MGFFQGLATGLAEGSTTAINKDMTRRQKQIDATVNRIADRRERQLEKADVHDESVKEYYEEIANEFDGDNVAALAAYNAMGGTLSSVKLIMDDYRQTKLVDPTTMSLSDRLGQEGMTYDKAKFGNISFDDALESLYKDVPTTEASDVQYQDTGLLSRLGLGKKDAGKSIAAQVNALIPGREAGEDYNISGATFDRTGMLAGELAKKEFEKGSMGELKANYFTDSTDQRLTEKQRQEARKNYDDIIASENIGKGLATNSSIASAYNIRVRNLQTYINNNTNTMQELVIGGVTYRTDDGTKETQIKKMMDNVNEEFSGVLIDSLTNLPISAAAESWLKLSGNDKYYKVANTEDKTGGGGGLTAEEQAAAEEEAAAAAAAAAAAKTNTITLGRGKLAQTFNIPEEDDENLNKPDKGMANFIAKNTQNYLDGEILGSTIKSKDKSSSSAILDFFVKKWDSHKEEVNYNLSLLPENEQVAAKQKLESMFPQLLEALDREQRNTGVIFRDNVEQYREVMDNLKNGKYSYGGETLEKEKEPESVFNSN